MVWKVVSAAIFAVAAGIGAASAQSAGDFSGPRELPPAGFSGQQYVDSRGCVFLRAGLSGRVSWVPRVSANRQQLCGYPPTFAKQQIDVVEDAPRAAPAPAAQPSGRRPIETVATTTTPPKIRQAPPKASARVPAATYAAPPVVMAAPRQVVVTPKVQTAPAAPKLAAKPAPAPAPKRVAKGGLANGCYADAPQRETFAVRGGGTITLCTAGNGDLASARPPRLAGGAAAVAPSGYVETPRQAAPRVVVSSQDQVAVPKGYKTAWKDDRLNTRRAIGTEEGWAQQDQVWTREVPARSVEAAQKAGKKVIVVRRVSVSSKSAPSEPAAPTRTKAKGGAYIQVGTFGVPANADGAVSRLKSLGLPVARAKTSKSGKALQIVLAGPFGSSSEAQAALSATRRAGFGDAFLR